MKPMRSALVVFALAAFAAPSLVHGGEAYRDPIYGYTVTSNVVFRPNTPTPSGDKDLLCDVYHPVDIGQGPVPTNRPAIVIQDGGTWSTGGKDSGRVVVPSRYLAQHGFTIVNTDYRVWELGYYLGGFTGDTEFGSRPYSGLDWPFYLYVYPGEEVIRAGIEDLAVAVAWTRSNAASLGIDSNRIGVCGGSSGGIDALCLQYNNNPVPAGYAAQAVMGIVSTMYGNWDRINPGGPPLWLLNNVLDPLIWYAPDVAPDLHDRLDETGIYYEQWFQEAQVNHDFDYNEIIEGVPVMERMKDYFCDYLAGGPLPVGYTLALSVAPAEAGAIVADPLPGGDGTYPAGTVVTLTANPAAEYLFDDWSGDASGTDSTVVLTMNGHKSVTANFVEGQALMLNVVNSSWGTVTVEPNLPLYLPGATVTLTAAPVEGKSFTRWAVWDDPSRYPDTNYATTDSNLALYLTMDHDYTVEAAFKCGSGVSEVLPLLGTGLLALGIISRRVRRKAHTQT